MSGVAMVLRIRIAGTVGIEVEGRLTPVGGARQLSAFVYLVLESGRAVPRDELAEVVWGDASPASWETTLRMMVSRVRAALAGSLGEDAVVSATSGCYRLDLIGDVEVDVEVASRRLSEAGVALRGGRAAEAAAAVEDAVTIASQQLLRATTPPGWTDSGTCSVRCGSGLSRSRAQRS